MRSRREVLRVLGWSGAGAVFGSMLGCGQGGGTASKTENLENRDILVKPQLAVDGGSATGTGAAPGGACGLPSETPAGSTCGKADAQAAATQGDVADAGASDGSAGPDAGPGAQGGLEPSKTEEAVVKIELTHDVICPWCRIGHHRLKQAIVAAGRTPESVEVVYRAFLLDPDVPADGVDLRQRLAEKYGAASLDGMFERVTQIGRGDGLTFDFAKVTRTPNTISAHMLVEAAPTAAKTAFLDRLHTAYFERGDDIGNREVLLGHWVDAGLARGDGERALDDAALRGRVTAEAAGQARAGVRGVPFFRIGATTVSGAQSVAVLADAIRKA
jgi:predicted DsbA family dithiol-disulfide isomerase